ncbi:MULTISPECIES: DUF2786 domain-containing protein [Acinetobacter calcoaceticus/baumannii complex]|uniref:DUF2786 domain-containing protein n=2 Tax=Acinetobacter baumannii TaxID=470 RepID=A0A7S8WHJ2_ACIBA|nr:MULTISPECIES: DUF2786 domain-containing protein [Acinetobacter calcoaceticus/baumannii complex]AZN69865.1 DUF2786 domain-containing protein [Acinetobacter haemolyticus]EXH12437.1 hypothetical protein J627_2511 [Acinetobacter sp. 1245593]MBF6763896.1 DUF2786 domain-containing protein [Acinetobacter baumannii]MBF6779191.1 DUF2786 domain-containing protein [Acinetobacter baumannii]MBF6805827.1 DUF2786 domain-containing protein [Acinetobacter baumannii]
MEDMQSIIDKISKCLALSKSANEHEAAIALKQAQALMQKHKINEKQVLLSDVKENIIRTKNQRNKDIELRLKSMIANVFECGTYLKWYSSKGKIYQQYVFYGIEPNVSIAAYAYSVLLPILIRNKQNYLTSLHGNTKLKSKRKLGISYHRGWIQGVEGKCKNLHPNEELKDKLKEFEKTLNLTYYDVKDVKHYNKDMLTQARINGYSDGSKVNLHRAIDPNDEKKKIFLSCLNE